VFGRSLQLNLLILISLHNFFDGFSMKCIE
jgi:hypothetical protein